MGSYNHRPTGEGEMINVPNHIAPAADRFASIGSEDDIDEPTNVTRQVDTGLERLDALIEGVTSTCENVNRKARMLRYEMRKKKINSTDKLRAAISSYPPPGRGVPQT